MKTGTLIRKTCKECKDMRCGNNPNRDPRTVPARSIHSCMYFGKLSNVLKRKENANEN